MESADLALGDGILDCPRPFVATDTSTMSFGMEKGSLPGLPHPGGPRPPAADRAGGDEQGASRPPAPHRARHILVPCIRLTVLGECLVLDVFNGV